jgi:hypothetical protein
MKIIHTGYFLPYGRSQIGHRFTSSEVLKDIELKDEALKI